MEGERRTVGEIRRIMTYSAACGATFAVVLALIGRFNAANVGGIATGCASAMLNICLLARSVCKIAASGADVVTAKRAMRLNYTLRMLLTFVLSIAAIELLCVNPLTHLAFMPIASLMARLRRR